MSANRFKIDGLFELKQALRDLPKELTDDAQAIIFESADQAGASLTANYPVRRTGLNPGLKRKSPWFAPGRLQKSVRVIKEAGQFTTTARVKSNDPIAWLYDHGSEARHHDSGKLVGRMPPTFLFIKTMIRYRRAMYDQLRALLESKGIKVTGEP
jgi:hypothetical protein